MTKNEKPTVTQNNVYNGVPDLSRTTTLTGTLSAAPKLKTEYITASKKRK
jgi:hypothetical protein